MWRLIKAAFLLTVLIAWSFAQASAHISVSPPPAWSEASAQKASSDTVAFFTGPSGSSFIMTRLKPLDSQSRPAVLSFLTDVLSSLQKKTGIPMTPATRLKESHFNNGIAALSLKVKAGDKPRLILSLITDGNKNYLSLINSAIPDLTLQSLLSSIRTSRSETPRPSQTISTDGQLLFRIPDDFHLATLSDADKNSGVVFSVSGLDSNLIIKKVSPQETFNPQEASKLLKEKFESLSSIDRWLISPEKTLSTPAGPELIYLSAGVKGEGALNAKALGYMPWCYWAYMFTAEGPRSEELITSVFKNLSPGPSVIERLLEQTPKLKASKNSSPYKIELGLTMVLTLFAAYLTIRSRKQKRRG
jgi:hypothetical protein